jgi:hypothetical protein
VTIFVKVLGIRRTDCDDYFLNNRSLIQTLKEIILLHRGGDSSLLTDFHGGIGNQFLSVSSQCSKPSRELHFRHYDSILFILLASLLAQNLKLQQ